MRPASAIWIVAALISAGLAGHTYHISIQVPDSLEIIQDMRALPSVRAAFVEGLRSSQTMLRPLRQVQTKLLVDAGTAVGGHYHLVFRGYHAILIALLIVLFVVVAQVNSWTDMAACIVGLTVLLGMHTFASFVREAYPVNHFLLIAIYGLGTLALAQARGGWLSDITALVLFAAAMLTLESGVLLVVIAIAAYISGLRGLSRRAIAGMLVLCLGYAALRMGYLDMSAPGVGDRPTAIGVAELSTAEQTARFGSRPALLFLHNVVTSIVSVLLSQPRAGRWTIVEAVLQRDIPASFYIEILSSIAATVLIAWYVAGRDDRARRRWRESIPLVFLTVLIANSIISYSYTKNEIVSISGVLYALVVYVAVRHLLSGTRTVRPAIGLAIFLLVFNSAWALRAAGLQTILLRAAASARIEWAGVLTPATERLWPGKPDTQALTMRMKDEAISRRATPAAELPRWTHRWWSD